MLNLPVAATETACKCKSYESIVKAFNITQQQVNVTCQYVNDQLLATVQHNVTPEQFQRYNARGKKLVTAEDIQYTAGPSWVASGLSIKIVNDKAVVTSTALHTTLEVPFGLDGMQYCKLLSPARMVEWIMIDSLKSE